MQFIGTDARRLLVRVAIGRAVAWDRTTNTKTLVYANNESDLAPDGRSLLYRGSVLDTWRHLDPAHPVDAVATFRGTGGYWTGTGTGSASGCVVDLRRHVLLGLVQGFDEAFLPAGSDLLAVPQPLTSSSIRLLLVDPTPVPDVDDEPRRSSAKPATGARVETAEGAQVHVQLGASDLHSTPVNLYFR